MSRKASYLPKPKPLDRAKLIAQVHIGTARLYGREDADAHADHLESKCGEGKRSCADLTDLELDALARDLRKSGALEGDGRSRGGAGKRRPTRPQWAKLGALARAKGWDGLESQELQDFVRRTAKVANSRFLTRDGMTKCLAGLEKWLAEDQAKAEGRP